MIPTRAWSLHCVPAAAAKGMIAVRRASRQPGPGRVPGLARESRFRRLPPGHASTPTHCTLARLHACTPRQAAAFGFAIGRSRLASSSARIPPSAGVRPGRGPRHGGATTTLSSAEWRRVRACSCSVALRLRARAASRESYDGTRRAAWAQCTTSPSTASSAKARYVDVDDRQSAHSQLLKSWRCLAAGGDAGHRWLRSPGVGGCP